MKYDPKDKDGKSIEKIFFPFLLISSKGVMC